MGRRSRSRSPKRDKSSKKSTRKMSMDSNGSQVETRKNKKDKTVTSSKNGVETRSKYPIKLL